MLTVSIVLYKTKTSQLDAVLNCTLDSTCVDKIYLIDNSPTDELKSYADYNGAKDRIIYIYNNGNIGYGSAHNIALHKVIEEGGRYHLVLNPDVRFENDVLEKCLEYMEKNADVGYLLPKVTYPNGELQYLCKLLPTPSDLIFRRFLPKSWKIVQEKNDAYVLKKSGYNKIMNPPCLSGCFMLLRLSTLQKYNIFFDERFFMYFEDFDLMRRIHRVAKTIYYPELTIIHDHMQESYKNKRMLLQHIKSACRYFNKYGWICDKERKIFNKRILFDLC
jgi:GT2 family glycosyltransferase